MANFCPNCGSALSNPNAQYCPVCGAAIYQSTTTYVNPAPTAYNNMNTVNAALGTLVAVTLAGGITRQLYYRGGRYFIDPYCRNPFAGRIMGPHRLVPPPPPPPRHMGGPHGPMGGPHGPVGGPRPMGGGPRKPMGPQGGPRGPMGGPRGHR